MIKSFKIYESDKWNDNYITCTPSGEVIYIDDNDLIELNKKHLIFIDNEDGLLKCSDFFYSKITQYIRDKKDLMILSRPKIIEFLLECGLLSDQFVINVDLSVDAKGPVDMSYMNLSKIPVKFNRCTSNFVCSNNSLTTLENSPSSVHGNFNCSFNKLVNLKGGPIQVSQSYNCSNNNLISLEGSPKKLNFFNCSSNYLKDLSNGPEVSKVYIKNNNLF